jgi:hypothetical protein
MEQHFRSFSLPLFFWSLDKVWSLLDGDYGSNVVVNPKGWLFAELFYKLVVNH